MKGKFSGLWLNPSDKTVNLLLTVPYEAKNLYDKLKEEDLDIEIKKYRKKRSLDANGLLWHCLSEIAGAMNPPVDKWDVYLDMLKHYGKHSYICVRPEAVESLQRQWRESEVIGEIDINGEKATQVLCYYGSSTMNSKEFSVLLNGVIAEMENLGLTPPPSSEMQRLLDNIK